MWQGWRIEIRGAMLVDYRLNETDVDVVARYDAVEEYAAIVWTDAADFDERA